MPDLRRFCRARWDLDFELVDPELGVATGGYWDAESLVLALREIAACRALSAGPAFALWLNERYGQCMPPLTIAKAQYELLLESVVKEQPAGAAAALKRWYALDAERTSGGPAYVLRPVAAVLGSSNSGSDAVETAQARRRGEWAATSAALLDSLRRAAVQALLPQVAGAAENPMHPFFHSLLEQQIVAGLLDHPAAMAPRTVLMQRKFQTPPGIPPSSPGAPLYSDMLVGGLPDVQAGRLLTVLTSRLLPTVVPEQNVSIFTPPWRDDPAARQHGVVPAAHAAYLGAVCKRLADTLKRQVDEAMDRRVRLDPLHEEVLCHNMHALAYGTATAAATPAAASVAKTTGGSPPAGLGHVAHPAAEASVWGYIYGQAPYQHRQHQLHKGGRSASSAASAGPRRPLIVCGLPGSGRTYFIARLATQLQERHGGRVCVAVRFARLGTADSHSVDGIVTNVCQQIEAAYADTREDAARMDLPARFLRCLAMGT